MRSRLSLLFAPAILAGSLFLSAPAPARAAGGMTETGTTTYEVVPGKNIIQVILSLSILDALFTLELIGRGAQELNPVMAFFLQFGHLPFLLSKYLLTASGLMALLILKNCTVWGGKISAKVVLLTIPFLYMILIGYEVLLLLRV